MPDDRSTQPRRTPNETASPRRYTVAPNIHTAIAVKTLPHAVCRVHAEGDADPKRSLKIYADDRGIVRFHVQPSTATDQLARFEIDCTVDDRTIRYPLHLRADGAPNTVMPAPPVETALARRYDSPARPALSLDEAMHLTDEQAFARGFPLRPNPDEAPKAFNAWLRCVSMPGFHIEPHQVSNPDISHGKNLQHSNANSKNWCGYERLRSLQFSTIFNGGVTLTDPYDWIAGSWHVPFVTGENGKTTYSSLWVGLDGDGTTDLVQAGTEQEVTTVDFGFIKFAIMNYYAWTEFLPQQPTEQVITNFVVNPGDEIYTEVSVGGADGVLALNGAFGRFLVMNLTTGGYTFVYTPRAPTSVSGREAVWIIERPTVNGSLPDLANFGSAVMSSASARTVNSPRHQGYVPYLGGNNKIETMVNGAHTLSTVTAVDSGSMRFDWKAFN